MNWLLWGFLLIVQNAAFTLVSRARNSKSLFYHAWASLLSNGIWFASQFILVDEIVRILKQGDVSEAIPVGLVYIGCTMAGSLGMHWVALNKLEREKK